MKNKILLLAVLTVLLICAFVLCVNAEAITYEGQEIELVNNLGDPSWYTGNVSSKITDKDSYVILKDSDGNLTVMDTTAIQYYLAHLKTNYAIGETVS